MADKRLAFYNARVKMVELETNPYLNWGDEDFTADRFLQEHGFVKGSHWNLNRFAVPCEGHEVRVSYDSGGIGNLRGGWFMIGDRAFGGRIDRGGKGGRYIIQNNETISLYIKGYEYGYDKNWQIHCEVDEKTRFEHGKELTKRVWKR